MFVASNLDGTLYNESRLKTCAKGIGQELLTLQGGCKATASCNTASLKWNAICLHESLRIVCFNAMDAQVIPL